MYFYVFGLYSGLGIVQNVYLILKNACDVSGSRFQ